MCVVPSVFLCVFWVVFVCLNVRVAWDVLCDVVWCVCLFCLRVLVCVSFNVFVYNVCGLSFGGVWLVYLCVCLCVFFHVFVNLCS